MPLLPQPLFVLHADAAVRARVQRAVPTRLHLVEVPGWDALHLGVGTAPPGAVAVVDPSHGHGDATPAPALADPALLRRCHMERLPPHRRLRTGPEAVELTEGGNMLATAAARFVAEVEGLRRCAPEGSGWRWGRVRGWLLYDDVADAVAERVSEVLPRLAGLGLVQRVDVRPPARSSPVWMYRVTDEGLRLLAEREGGAAPSLPPVREDPADAGTFFVPRRIWPGLRLLQSRTRSGAGGGWLSLRQLAAARARLDSEDAGWLVRNALVERQREERDGVPGPWRFRVTATGLRVERTAAPSPGWVRVRLAPLGATEEP